MSPRAARRRSARAKEISGSGGERYDLRLYVTGATARSARAVQNIRRICDELLRERYALEVVDLYEQPEMAKADQLVVAPTLVKRLPPPTRRLVGDMADRERVLRGLDLATGT
ncbi:MAG TPA: circadian clock KaiB family protein [Candidatus Binatia bacterium]|nr:circadian clock KaiB family protein [Candidatus Binatia bacterium]